MLDERLNKPWWALRLSYGLVPIIAGLDKFTNLLVDWKQYLNPVAERVLPFSGSTFMRLVGVVEIVAGVLVLTKLTRVGRTSSPPGCSDRAQPDHQRPLPRRRGQRSRDVGGGLRIRPDDRSSGGRGGAAAVKGSPGAFTRGRLSAPGDVRRIESFGPVRSEHGSAANRRRDHRWRAWRLRGRPRRRPARASGHPHGRDPLGRRPAHEPGGSARRAPVDRGVRRHAPAIAR